MLGASNNSNPRCSMKPVVFLAAAVVALSFPFVAHALNKTLGPKSYVDARQCLELPTNEAIIRCAERFM
jgi:hypothetical protein